MRTPTLLATLAFAALAVPSGAAGQETRITGFVDASWFYDTARANGEFGLDQAEIDVHHQASDKARVRADLEWIKNGEAFDVQVEQAYLAYLPGAGWTVTFGRFNAPIGFELLDPVDMYQFSHSLVFDHGLPANLTGVSLARDLGRGFDLVAYGCNGWDRNATGGPNLTWGGRCGYARGGFGGGVAAISGQETDAAAAASTRTVVDVDLRYERDRWLFGGEYNQGYGATDHAADQDWTAFLVMARYAVAAWAGLTVRYDRFDDEDGYAFDAVGGQYQRRQSLTVAPTITLDDGCCAVVELRLDRSDQDAFTDGDGAATDRQTTIAFEMTYAW